MHCAGIGAPRRPTAGTRGGSRACLLPPENGTRRESTMHKHLLGSRFYVYSNDATHPNSRTDTNGLLVAICHGFYRGAGMTAVKGVGQCAFFCDHGDTVDAEQLVPALDTIGSGIRGNGGFWHDPTNRSGEVYDYTLSKEIDGKAKKSFKGKQNHQFADS